MCDYKAVNRGAVAKHMSCKHPNNNVEPGVGKANEQIREWVSYMDGFEVTVGYNEEYQDTYFDDYMGTTTRRFFQTTTILY